MVWRNFRGRKKAPTLHPTRKPDALASSESPGNFSGPEISAYERSDLETLWQIDQRCFPPGISYSRSELESYVSQKSAKTWVARSGEQITGFVLLAREPRNVGHIITIDVIAEARHQHVGSALMKTAEDWAVDESLTLLYLETAEDNLIAQSFYTVRGYAKVDEIPGYYSNGKTAWVMVKWL